MIRITKPAVNIREKLAELERPIGLNGAALMATSTPQDAFSLIGARNRNLVINGDMRIDQRNVGNAVSASIISQLYTIDRWYIQNLGSSVTFSIQRSTNAPAGFSNSLLVTTSTGASIDVADSKIIEQRIEGFNIVDLNWGTSNAKPITLSFWTRSSLTGTFGGAIVNSGANRIYAFTYQIISANTWEYKTITIPGDTTGTWLTDNGVGIRCTFNIGSGSNFLTTAGSWQTSGSRGALGTVGISAFTGATWQITGVQLEAGKVATPFEYRSYGQELALCQRYFYVLPNHYHFLHKNSYFESQLYYFPVTMRAAPNMTDNGSWVLVGFQAASTTAYTGFGYYTYPDGFFLGSTTSNNSNFYTWVHNSTTIFASAEL